MKSAAPFQHRKGGVPFVQMTHLRIQAEPAQQPPAADTQNEFLSDAGFRAAAVQLRGNPAHRWRIGRIVAVEQIKPQPTDLRLPGPHPNRIAGKRQLEADPLPLRIPGRSNGQLPGIVDRIQRFLGTVGCEHLAKITLLIEQTHCNHRHAKVAGGFELIPGDIAKPPRIDRQRFTQHEFHAEIGNSGHRCVRVLVLKPARSAARLAQFPRGLRHPLAKTGVSNQLLHLFRRDRLQNESRISRAVP
jgi:hypothetical protein